MSRTMKRRTLLKSAGGASALGLLGPLRSLGLVEGGLFRPAPAPSTGQWRLGRHELL